MFYVHSSIHGHFGWFHILAIVNNAAMNIEVHISFQISVFIFFKKIPRNGIAELYDSSVFNFLRNLHNVIHSGCNNLYPHQWCMRVPFSPHLPQCLVVVVFFIIAILTGVRCYFIVVSFCICLIISNVQHFFMYLFAICMSSLEKNAYSNS